MGITILLIVAGLIAALLVYASTRPDRFSVQRKISIDASPEKVFPLINDFQQWGYWSPWATRDPSMSQSFSGPARGEGAIYSWSGNNKVGDHGLNVFVRGRRFFVEQISIFADHATTQRRLREFAYTETFAHPLPCIAARPLATRTVSQRPGVTFAITDWFQEVTQCAA